MNTEVSSWHICYIERGIAFNASRTLSNVGVEFKNNPVLG